jgi:riboflavin biosynthesis pyrimidine reductase
VSLLAGQVRRIEHAHRTGWANTTVLSGDLAAAIGRLKAKPAGELRVHGSGALTRWLLENDLVDETNLLIVPVVVGQGTRLFPVGNEKYLVGFWIIEAADLDVALKLAAEGSKACNRKVEVRPFL